MIAIDFGTGAALAIFGPDGPISKSSLQLPRVPGGKTPRDEFRLILSALLERDDVVVESPTIGSSGCEPDDVAEIVTASPHRLFTLSARAVKNHRMDHKIPNPKSYVKYETVSDSTQEEAHILDAEILYRIATTQPLRLRNWHLAEPCNRIHTSVRPMDKRGYRDERSENLMSRLPDFGTLPRELQLTLGVVKGKTRDYSRSLIMPFAQALTEPFLEEGPPEERRKRFEKILGIYDHGYPSHYRRMANSWMQKIAADLLGLERYSRALVSPKQRKRALKISQRQIRMLFHLCETKA